MKKLQLENFGVQELDAKEMKEIDGGFLAFLLFGIIALVALIASEDYWIE